MTCVVGKSLTGNSLSILDALECCGERNHHEFEPQRQIKNTSEEHEELRLSSCVMQDALDLPDKKKKRA